MSDSESSSGLSRSASTSVSGSASANLRICDSRIESCFVIHGAFSGIFLNIEATIHTKLGIIAALMSHSPQYCQYPIACLTLWIEPAIRHEQIHLFRDETGSAVGYVTWAWLAADAEYRLIHDPEVLLHISEWNEGDRLWILDFFLLASNVRARVREMTSLFDKAQEIRSLRRRPDGSLRAVRIWHRRTSQITSPAPSWRA